MDLVKALQIAINRQGDFEQMIANGVARGMFDPAFRSKIIATLGDIGSGKTFEPYTLAVSALAYVLVPKFSPKRSAVQIRNSGTGEIYVAKDNSAPSSGGGKYYILEAGAEIFLFFDSSSENVYVKGEGSTTDQITYVEHAG